MVPRIRTQAYLALLALALFGPWIASAQEYEIDYSYGESEVGEGEDGFYSYGEAESEGEGEAEGEGFYSYGEYGESEKDSEGTDDLTGAEEGEGKAEDDAEVVVDTDAEAEPQDEGEAEEVDIDVEVEVEVEESGDEGEEEGDIEEVEVVVVEEEYDEGEEEEEEVIVVETDYPDEMESAESEEDDNESDELEEEESSESKESDDGEEDEKESSEVEEEDEIVNAVVDDEEGEDKEGETVEEEEEEVSVEVEVTLEEIDDGEEVVEEEEIEVSFEPVSCEDTQFGCCTEVEQPPSSSNDTSSVVVENPWWDSFGAETLPSHGSGGVGCCLASKYGCCPDGVSASPGPFGEGCGNCSLTEFGCCEDRRTPTRGNNGEGCGCFQSEFGCCPDFRTPAPPPGEEGDSTSGCPCIASAHGCCPDGSTSAQGPTLEGCPTECQDSPGGCCPDGVTPAPEDGEGCGCEASEHGCCRDGLAFAKGPDFQGCDEELPGAGCLDPIKAGPCDNYTERWFYDGEYGGCSRFWFGGCDAGRNNFETEAECKGECVEPRGAAACYLKKVPGPCDGSYEEWYYESSLNECRPFLYSGCLGNSNRFPTKPECEETCKIPDPVQTDDSKASSLCKLQPAEGACLGDFPRWFYNVSSGLCEPFSFSGCRGNANRFLSQADCSNACAHEARRRRTDVVCGLPIVDGATEECPGENETSSVVARWGHDPFLHRCVPFYFFPSCSGGEEPNENSFSSVEDCESTCPASFPPEISLADGDGGELVAEAGDRGVIIRAEVRASPPARIRWTRLIGAVEEEVAQLDPSKGLEIDWDDGSYERRRSFRVLEDGSLRLPSPLGYSESGSYAVWADNGVGKGERREVDVVVHPFTATAAIFVPGEEDRGGTAAVTAVDAGDDLTVECRIRAYPPLDDIGWKRRIKLRGGRRGRNRQEVEEEVPEDRFWVSTEYRSRTTVASVLRARNVTAADVARYTCSSLSRPTVSASIWLRVSYGGGGGRGSRRRGGGGGAGVRCEDRGPEILIGLDCARVVVQGYCGNVYYSRLCCASCARAGYEPPEGDVRPGG